MFKPSHIYAFSLGAGVTLILMLFIGYGLDGNMGFCKLEAAGSPTETPVTCAREWIGALSGWVAAIVAYLVVRPQLKMMQLQAASVRAADRLETIGVQIEVMANIIQKIMRIEPPVFQIGVSPQEVFNGYGSYTNKVIDVFEELDPSSTNDFVQYLHIQLVGLTASQVEALEKLALDAQQCTGDELSIVNAALNKAVRHARGEVVSAFESVSLQLWKQRSDLQMIADRPLNFVL
ncbi:hypothetical protein [Cohaesibacter haloalkalitolerans]|uniref:hypothetical protein n=1 Tax=Cohaesibacter haloalkalitolerans TaxID=1162980 RepID=UPI000E651944|nr:hypothetical protein [Cohaesibacter haloalkalitolerans]